MATAVQVARLEAGAKGGTAGVKEFDDAQTQVRSARTDAVNGMNADASKINAPGALTQQLDRQISAPGNVALAGLASQGQAAAATNNADQSGTDLYFREASAALPVVNAYANRDLGQQLAMLAAQRSAKKAPAVTDEQIRDEFLGQAENARAQRASSTADQYQADLQHLAQTDMQRRKDSAAVLANPSAGTSGSNQSSASRSRLYGAPAASQELATPQAAMANLQGAQQSTFDQQRQQKLDALAALQNRLAGPGISQEAIAAGTAAGIDPNRLGGIFTPQVDASYVNAEKSLGLYKDPAATTVRNVMYSNDQAAQLAGRVGVPGVSQPLSKDELAQIQSATFFDWTSNSHLNNAFKSWMGNTANAKVVRANTDTSTGVQNLDALHSAFEQSAQAAPYKTNYVGDIEASALNAIRNHVGYQDFVQSAMAYPAYQGRNRTLALVFAKVKPLFDAALVHDTRTAQPGGYNDPTAYAG